MDGHSILGFLFALDTKAIENGITREMCFELQVLIDEILKLDGFDKTKLDGDLIYCCNQTQCTSNEQFTYTLDQSIRVLSEYVHPMNF